ncbi:hypothetical protein HN51_022861 [Arachis hypogaea]
MSLVTVCHETANSMVLFCNKVFTKGEEDQISGVGLHWTKAATAGVELLAPITAVRSSCGASTRSRDPTQKSYNGSDLSARTESEWNWKRKGGEEAFARDSGGSGEDESGSHESPQLFVISIVASVVSHES